MFSRIIILMGFVYCLSGCLYQIHATSTSIPLGNKVVKVVREDYGPGKVFVHVHANETTALKAARKVARIQGGQVITLVHEKNRDIEFDYHGRHYAFDPNRIYTHQGVVRTLKQHHCYHPQVVPLIENFGKKVLASIPKGKVIAVHNNQEYSLLDYLPHHELALDAKNLYYRPKIYYRNFFLVTRADDFNFYRSMGFNVVQQANGAFDDGSLSIALKRHQYINVEAGFDQLHHQVQMLKRA
jgi:hypothetical protein